MASAASEDVPGSSNTDHTPTKHGLKRCKNKSKVWERVAWFTRRSRSKETSMNDTEDADALSSSEMLSGDLDLSQNSATTSGQREEDDSVNPCRRYPNSEIIEQNCLKPSTARALFLQLEVVSQRSGTKPPKYSFQTKKRRRRYWTLDDFHGEDNEEPMSRAVSVPGGISEVVNSRCHCDDCCNCSVTDRLQGLCPRYSYPKRRNSTASLDLALSHHRSLAEIPNSSSSSKFDSSETGSKNCVLVEGSHLGQSCTDVCDWDLNDSLNQYKSNSLPAKYSSKLQKKCPKCDKLLLVSHLPYVESRPTTENFSQGPALPTDSPFCQCPPVPPQTYTTSDTTTESCTTKPNNTTVVPETLKGKTEMIVELFEGFDDSQKNALLKKLLAGCQLPQLHLLSVEMESRLHLGCPPNCCDTIGWLPPSLSLHIFSFLDPVSLCQASAVCWRWYELTMDTSLWRHFCSQPKWCLSLSGEQKQLLQHMLPNGDINWKKAFAERYKLYNNWIKGRCTVRTFEGHTQGISCVQFDDTRIVSGSSDKTIKVWNIRTNSPWLVQTLTGHSGTVRCLHLDGNRLVSGSTDRTIKVWDLSTQQSWSSIACKVTMVGHLDTVRCLQVDEEKVISGSYDKSLKVWDIRSGVCSMTLRGHQAGVLCVQFDRSKIISGSCDKTIKVWSLDGACLTTLHGHQDAVTCLQFNDSQIISGSLDCNLKFWQLSSGTCQKTIDWKASEGHTGVVRCLQADSWRVVSASDDRTLKVWSLDTGGRLATLRNHTDGVTCLQFNDSIIVSGSYDKTVKLWDFSCC